MLTISFSIDTYGAIPGKDHPGQIRYGLSAKAPRPKREMGGLTSEEESPPTLRPSRDADAIVGLVVSLRQK